MEKDMENVKKNKKIKKYQTCNNWRKEELFSIRTNYYTTKLFTENLLIVEMKKQIYMNKPVYLGLSILELSKTVMYEFFMISWNQIMVKKQNSVICIQAILFYI